MGVISEIKNDLDKGALRLLSEYRGLLLSQAKTLVSSPEEAEDLVFCTIERVLAKSDTYDSSKGDLLTWMKAIMTNLHRDGHRRKLADAVSYCPNEELAETADESAADAVLANSDDEYVRQVVASLPPELREVIVLQYFAEQPVAKVAKILAIPPGTVASRVHLAKKILLKKLGPEFGKVKKPLAVLGAILLSATALFGAYQLVKVEERGSGLLTASEKESEQSASLSASRGAVVSTPQNEEVLSNKSQENTAQQANETQAQEKPAMKLTQTFAAAAFVAGISLNAVAYEDDYLSVVGDESVRMEAVDGRLVYIFTNASTVATVTLKQKLTLEEALVVGGGGGGGGKLMSGGGGGGGVWHDTSWRTVDAGSSISVTVGAGGAGNSGSSFSTGGDGGASTLSVGTLEVTAPGGGGGGCWETTAGRPGASGGGGTKGFPGAGIEGFGHRGGIGALGGAGGGGGAYEYGGHTTISGNNTNPGSAGKGGDGRVIGITGELHCYGSGGGGGSNYGGADSAGLPVHRPGEGGLEGGGRGGSPVEAGVYTYKGVSGVDGLGGGGGGSGGVNNGGYAAGKGGCGTVILAFTVGDTTAKRFAVEDIKAYPIQNGVALPAPTVRDATSGEVLEEGTHYTVAGFRNTEPGQAEFVVKGVPGSAYDGVQFRAGFEAVRAVFAAPDGTAVKDGGSWETATDLMTALAVANADAKTEVWLKSGTYALTAVPTVTTNATIRGGFAGSGANLAQKAGARSVFDAGGTLDYAFKISKTFDGTRSYSYWVRVFDCEFRSARLVGAYQCCTVSSLFEGCRFTDNGGRDTSSTTLEGGGAYLATGSGLWIGTSYVPASCLTLRDCLFDGNHFPANVSNKIRNGAALFLNGFSIVYRGLTMDGCTFVTNGLPAAEAAGSGCQGVSKGVVYIGHCGGVIRNSRFIGNRHRSQSDSSGSILYLYRTGLTFDHCAFVGNELCACCAGALLGSMGVVHVDQNQATFLDPTNALNHCTFAYNLLDTGTGAATTLAKGHLKVRNSLFYGNKTGKYFAAARDVYAAAGTTLEIEHSLFASTEANVCYGPSDPAILTRTVGLSSGDPRFVSTGIDDLLGASDNLLFFDPARISDVVALDVHLKSSAGYRTNADDVWHLSPGVVSAGLDAGDPLADWSNEPTPNGNRVNVGVYGATAQASKTPESAPAFASDVEVTFPTEYSQPLLAVSLGGSGEYSASVTFSCSSNGTDWMVSEPVTGLGYGDTARWLVPAYFDPAGRIYVKAELNCSGKSEATPVSDYAVSGKMPIWSGKGGGANVVHVRAGATGRGDGSSWTDALTDIYAGLSALTATRNELWVAGDVTTEPGSGVNAVSISSRCTLRGGFDGHENNPDERSAGAVSAIDFGHAADGVKIQNSAAIAVERLKFRRALRQGFVKTGGGSIAMTNCAFEANGIANADINGRGASFTGVYGADGPTVRLSGCTFAGNIQTNTTVKAGKGTALYLEMFSRALVDDCLFISNGAPHAAAVSTLPPYNPDNGTTYGEDGVGIYAKICPLIVNGTRFVANRVRCASTGRNTGGGVVVTEDMRYRQLAFTNCLWLANENIGARASGGAASSVCINCANQSGSPFVVTSDFVNCTFAYNLTDASSKIGGINSEGCRVRILNSVFYGNCNGKDDAGTALSANGGADDISYTLLESTNSVWNADNGTVDFGDGMQYGNPKFVTSLGEFLPLVLTNASGLVYLNWTNDTAAAKLDALNVHLRGHNGYVDERTGELKKTPSGKSSPCIDAGDPQLPFLEPARGYGGRANLGFYGNTPWATRSPSGLLIIVK